MKHIIRKILCIAVVAAGAVCPNAAEISDVQWNKMKQDLLNKPRRVFLDNDGCDAINFPANKEVTLENFYDMMMSPMIGCQFDVLVYCAGGTGFAVTSKSKTNHRRVTSFHDGTENLKNITLELEQKFGKDPATLAMEFAHKNGFEFVMSMRANDTHDSFYEHSTPEFKKKHPEFLVGAKEPGKRPRFGNWSAYDYNHKEVRELFLTLVCEFFDNYDLDGFIIDFQRGDVYFKSVAQGGKPTQQELDTLTQLIRDIRAYAEVAARKRGRPMYFMFRAPDSTLVCKLMGLDIETWMKEKLFDIYVAGGDFGHYASLEENVALAKKYGLKVYQSQDISWTKGSPAVFNRNVDARYNADFAAAYAAGMDGVYMFNMVYATQYYPHVRRQAQDLAMVNKAYFVTTHRPRTYSAFVPKPGQQRMLNALFPEYPLNITSDRESHDFLLEIGDDFKNLPEDATTPEVKLHLKTSMAENEPLSVKINNVPLRFSALRNRVAVYDAPIAAIRPGQNILSIASSVPLRKEEITILSGKELLEGANQPPWRRLFPGNGAEGAENIVDNAYQLKSTGKGPVNLIYPLAGIKGQDLKVSVQAKVEPGSTPGSVSLRVANGRFIEVLDFIPGRVRLRYSAHQTNVDTSVFHEYVLTVSANGDEELWMDGRKILTGKLRPNATNTKLHLSGYAHDLLGMNDASILIGGLDLDANGTGYWRNLRLASTSLVVEDAVLQVTFPAKPSDVLIKAMDNVKEYIYEADCTNGVFPEIVGVKKGYPPLHAAKDRSGVLFNHNIGEYNMVDMTQFPPLQEQQRFMVVDWKLTCTKPPRTSAEQNFQVVMRPKSLKTPGKNWKFAVRSADGELITPFGSINIPTGTQVLRAAIDCQSGDVIVLLNGKIITCGKVSEQVETPGILFGDGSSIISGEAVLEYLKVAFFSQAD